MVSALGHCWVQFSQMESRFLWTLLFFSFGELWVSVQVDRKLAITGPTWFWL